ncbi:hypothetical protein pb186bvf_017273 [Paramecium bursaria]
MKYSLKNSHNKFYNLHHILLKILNQYINNKSAGFKSQNVNQ